MKDVLCVFLIVYLSIVSLALVKRKLNPKSDFIYE